MKKMIESIYVVCPPGLENVTAREMESVGIITGDENTAIIPGSGGIEFSGGVSALVQANYTLRSATRVLVRMGSFIATGFPELKRKVKRLPWQQFLRHDSQLALRVTCKKSRLYHSGAVEERVLAAIRSATGYKLPVVKDDSGSAAQLLVVRLQRDKCTISIDASGEALYRRGYRQAVAKAPLRENIAAAMLLNSDWDGEAPLLDPFCGSGTIPLEAALLSRGIMPGSQRSFAFLKWPLFDMKQWELFREKFAGRPSDRQPVIVAADRDAGAIDSCRANAERAAVLDSLTLLNQSFSAISPPENGPGWIVSNLPYGVRVSKNKDLRNLYTKMGTVFREKFSGWRFTLLVNDLQLFGHSRLKHAKPVTISNSGLRVYLIQGKIGD